MVTELIKQLHYRPTLYSYNYKYKPTQQMVQLQVHHILVPLLLLVQAAESIQLCSPYTQAYPCTACQPYATIRNGFCECLSGYYMNVVDQINEFCDLCHGSCKTCSGPLSTNCISCPDAFTFKNTTFTCEQANSASDEVIAQVYYIEGFTLLTDWSLTNFQANTYQCGLRTLLGGLVTAASNSIQVIVGSLPNHFRLRMRANFFFLSSNGVTKNASVQIGSNINETGGSEAGYSFQTCSNTGATYVTRAIDVSLLHTGASATILFYADAYVHYGIRDVIIIAQKCASNCSTCSGYLATECLTCTDGNRLATLVTVGTCQCAGNYYQEPYAGTCANPCPSVPIKYYGDNTTRNCVASCPTGFAYDDLMRCWLDCPQTSILSLKLLFRDYTNKKCVANCPSTEPYGDPVNRRCYAQCPSPRFGDNTTTKICVTSCPHTYRDSGIYKTYSSGRYCVPYCPNTTWADPATSSCLSTCTSAAFPLMDNSTGENLCVASCPPPNRFANSGSCIEICPSPKYGDIVTWACTTTCTSPNWGIENYNRKCVAVCPNNTWARTSDRKCVNTTLQCGPLYADNYTRFCVTALNCPYGTYANPDTYSCVTYCPSGRYGHPTTRVCQLTCAVPYFRDPGVNLCVTSCVTAGLYADVSSTRTCVTACNNLTGTTPWADDSTRTCVADCNNTIGTYLADNSTWKCVYDCPLTHVADFTTAAPKCVVTCPAGWFADDSRVTYRVCVQKCPSNPPQFGDTYLGRNLCVDVCAPGTFGDETGNRLCRSTCPTPYYAQNDGLRRCVRVCNESSFGYQETCTYHAVTCEFSYKRVCYESPTQCPTNWFGDNSTNLCVNPCPASQATFGDPDSRFCVRRCPDNPGYTVGSYVPRHYYADPTNRKCVLTCSSTASPPLFGNNQTRTCESKCLDHNSYAEVQSTYRICVDRCWYSPAFHYGNNLSKTCGTYNNCPSNYFGENDTQLCVEECPNNAWAYKDSSRRICLDKCPSGYKGDDSTTKRVCVAVCPDIPDRYADLVLRICVDMCNSSYYGDPTNRNCMPICPSSPAYFSYQPTRRCVQKCPYGYFADDRAGIRKCQPASSLCVGRFGDAYKRECVGICTGPTPVDTFGSGSDCVSFCPNGTYADSYSASRLCVPLCPPGVLNSVAAPNLYGDPTTHTCVAKCITPYTWADRQTRLCEPTCSAAPTPTYSQNIYMTCVTSLNCPVSPTMTFGDNTTRSCVSFCSNSEWGDPTSRNCVAQCPNVTTTGTSNYYGDSSTGQYLCVIICPSLPRLFGRNSTNLCVPECPALTFGDQTGNRTCVPQCPLIGSTYYFAQNYTRICVLVCRDATWGLKSTRECVEDPMQCGTQWADNTTHLCVNTCPASANLFGNFASRICVPTCPNGTYADDLSRTCVTRCPQNNGVHDTFGNNGTWICEQTCTQPNVYADPQTTNRYCVTQCSQSPAQSFADPSTKTCVPRCPTFPSLFGERDNFKCVTQCISPYFADTHSRRCVTGCDSATQFKLRSPRLCVALCPSSSQLYGDPGTGFCETSCSTGYRYAVLRLCVPSCTSYSLFDYNGTCVKYCPYGYYADTSGHCVSPCPLATLFGQNTTTTCRTTCITGYAYNRLCLAICPDGLWGHSGVCRSSCPTGTASNVSNLCVGNCDAGTFNEGGLCVTNCSVDYADPNTRLCSTSCTLGRYKEPVSHTCVELCPTNSYRDPSFACKTNCSPLRADNFTATCTNLCSNGTWGFNYECVAQCPELYYGYEVDRDCYDIPNIPDPDLFADNLTQIWVAECSVNPLMFGDTQTHECVFECSATDEYADPQSRKCETQCTNASYYKDPTTKDCVLICPQGYLANPQNGQCQVNCTHNLFDYEPAHLCVAACPKPYYGYTNATEKICVLTCLEGTFAEGVLCKPGCTLPLVADTVTNMCVSKCIDSYYSDIAVQCIAASSCATYGTIADSSTNKCVGQCPTDPDYYEQNGICVPYCAVGTFADPTPGLRLCTALCQEGLYGDPVSGRCLASCLPGYYAFNDTNLCVKNCPNGFADNETGLCVSDCPAPTFADSLNNRCMRICSNGQFGQDRQCVPTCRNSTFGNPITMECQNNCPDFDYTFAENRTHRCVRNCSVIPLSYADRNNNYCMDNCSLANQYMLDGDAVCTSLCPAGLYMENSTKRCQPGCDTGFAENTSRFCVAQCFGNPQTFAFTTNRVCLYSCKALGLYADNSSNFCVAFDNCSRVNNSYSDPISGHCVRFCPEGLYAEDTTYTCTSYCNTGYADNFTRTCTATCPEAEQTYGDPTTHRCVKVCPSGYYARNDTQVCVRFNNCPANTWSDIKSKHCVSRCPSEPLYFGYDGTTSCVSVCPSNPDLYGDYVTQKCIWPCTNSNGERRFADANTRTCVFVCPIELGYYGDPTTGRCTTSCDPANPYKDNSTQRCRSLCPSNPDYYAYDTNKTCVRVCPDNLYASNSTSRICTSTCQPQLTFKDDTTNRCVSSCPIPYFADNSTYKCVLGCPPSPDYYADPHSRTCVLVCPVGPNGADGKPIWMSWIEDVNRTCVTRCPPNYYAQNSSGRCMQQCPLNEYADPLIQRCVADCTVRPGYYKQTGSRTCVRDCPVTPVKAHRYEPTHVCVNMTGSVSGCIVPYYADELTDNCTTYCPAGYYADDTTRFCRLNCTNGKFADPVDRACKSGCTTNPHFFAYTGNMTCVQYCPAPEFSQNVTWTCTTSCPNMTDGSVLYSYNLTRQCVKFCPPPYFSYIANQTCLLGCPTGWYTNDDTRSCEQTCTGTFYADDFTNRCVETCPTTPDYYGLNHLCMPGCPNGTFKDNSTRTCVTQCPYLPLTFADDSSNSCVEDCPSDPNYFADNQTRTCVPNCTLGYFADPSTRTCVLNCPDDSGTFAEPVSRICQTGCPAPNYASQMTNQCVGLCPNLPVKTYAQDAGRFCTTRCITGAFGNNFTRKCEPNCLSLANSFADTTTNLCVTTCPIGFFAYNLTAECRRDCPGLYADSTTRKCVSSCPGTERLYSDSTTNTCVYICPVGWYGDDSTWTCQSSCASVSAGFILEVQRRCVPQCPSPYFALVSQRLCKENCGTGLYGDQITRECKTCPLSCTTCLGVGSCLSCTSSLYLEYGYCVSSCTLNAEIANYANNNSMTCGPALRCPAFTFGYNSTKACQSSCPTQMYGNSTTRTCQNCPSTCSVCLNLTYCSACTANAQLSLDDHMCYAHCNSTYQYTYSGECYTTCPPGTYVDFTNVNCLACNALCLTCEGNSMNCTGCDGTFKFSTSCVSQCPAGYYGLSNSCQVCTDTIPSCVNPLTFTTTSTVEQYQQVIVIKFNQQTNIKSNPENFINVNLQMQRRRLADVPSLINKGLGFKAVVLSDGTIKLYLDPGISLDNVKYTVSFTDPTQVTTLTGDSLQNLESIIELAKAEVYPDIYTYNAPLVVVGKVLAIVMLALTFIMLIPGLATLYYAIEAVQLTSLFAYTFNLAPNLFYFLKEMRLSRFLFIPSIFQNIYVAPGGYVDKIPQKVIDTEGQLSFAMNAGQYIYFIFLYVVMAAIVYAFTSKVNSNRPLKNLFIRIWETRIKFSVIQDFLWLFGINILTQAFMQARYEANGGDLGLGMVSAVLVLVLMVGLFGYGVRKFRENPQIIVDNYSLLFEGTKQETHHKFFIFIYYLRKILLAVIFVAAVFNTVISMALGLAVFSLVGLAILIVRPYKEHLNNFVLLANEGFLGFFCGGVIYYVKMIERGEPSGAKITNGYILTIVIIIHLCLLMSWSVYRSYFYLKQLREDFKQTEFYKLYMDEQYDEVLEKQISELNEEDKGQVESIQVTNIASNEGKQGDEDDQIIKLKIKRRVKKEKLNKKPQNPKEEQKQRDKGDYIKVEKQNENYYRLKQKNDNEYEKVIFDQSVIKQKNNKDSPIEESKQNDWVKMEKSEQPQKMHGEKEEIAQNVGYKETKLQNMSNIFDEVQEEGIKHEPQVQEKKTNTMEEEEKKRLKYLQTDKKMRQTFKSSFADFDESNFFNNEANVNQPIREDKPEVLKSDNQEAEDQVYSNRFQDQSQHDQVQEPLKSEQPEISVIKPIEEQQKAQQLKPTQQYSEIASVQNSEQFIAQQSEQNIQQQDRPKQQKNEYKVFDFDELMDSESQVQQERAKEKKEEKKNENWSVQIEDLIDDRDNADEEEKKRKQKAKKMHLMLFEDDEDQ